MSRSRAFRRTATRTSVIALGFGHRSIGFIGATVRARGGRHLPTGSITFSRHGRRLAVVPLTEGFAELLVPVRGTVGISAVYSGDSRYAPSRS